MRSIRVQRVLESVRDEGLAATALKLASPFADRRFDRQYGIDTCEHAPLAELNISSDNKERGAPYEPSRVLPVRRMLSQLRKMVPPGSALVDFGCGKGRVLLLAVEQGFRAVRGVEFAGELCTIARRNATLFQARRSIAAEVEIVEGDAARYGVRPDEHVFFFFHPFDEVVFSGVLENIAASLREHRRRALIVIIRPSDNYRRSLAARPEFSLEGEYRFMGTLFALYSSAELGLLDS